QNFSVAKVSSAAFGGKLAIDADISAQKADLIAAQDLVTLGETFELDISVIGTRALNSRVKIISSPETNVELTQKIFNNRAFAANFSSAESTLFSKTWQTRQRGIAYETHLERGQNGDIFMVVNGHVDPLKAPDANHNDSELYAALTRGAQAEASGSQNLLDTGALSKAHREMWEMMEADSALMAEAADEMSGQFFADLLDYTLVDRTYELVYENIVLPIDASTKYWGQVGGGAVKYSANENSLNDLNINVFKSYFGITFNQTSRSLSGVYVGFDSNSFLEGTKHAQMRNIEAGYYKGLFFGALTLKGNAAIGLQAFTTERNITLAAQESLTSGFNTYGLKAGVEAQYLLWLIEGLLPTDGHAAVKGFGGLHGGLASNDEIVESGDLGYRVDSAIGYKLLAEFGLRADGQVNMLNWFGKLFVGGLEFGSRAAYDMSIHDSYTHQDLSDIEAMRRQNIYAGLSAGVEYLFTARLSFNSRVTFKGGAGLFEYFGSVGATYRLGGVGGGEN
ncbi:MAG: autotransporter outer membrane beta-barrel domain-containing protein, partial [Elusimicrobiota bacterium]|nr:autotransporter outer membrane beta-barrel domain-containing protein [Elusimicrobiota bacterium]